MTAVERTPDNLNYLANHNFRFLLKKIPHVNFFCQTVNLPGITLPKVGVGSPFTNINHPGDTIQWNQLNVTFKVDEDMRNYLEIFDWIMALGYPRDFAQYKAIKDVPLYTGDGRYSDGTIMVQTNIKNFNKVITFQRMMPVALSELTLNSQADSVRYLDATATFSYVLYTIE